MSSRISTGDTSASRNTFQTSTARSPSRRRARGGRGHRGEKAPGLTPEQKAFNSTLSKARVVVEHTISRLKKFNIFGGEFRNRLKNYDTMTDIVSG